MDITAFVICSMICEIAVGTIVESPWKKPLRTPSMATMRITGPSTISAGAAKGVFKKPQSSSLNNNITSIPAVPVMLAKRSEPLSTRITLWGSAFAALAATSFDTARGILYEDIMSRILYIS